MNRMRIGFTGSRYGMTDKQKRMFIDYACEQPMSEFHHGDCVGADVEAVALLMELGAGGIIHYHPGTGVSENWMAKSDNELGVWHPPLYTLQRNVRIVDSVDLMIACPRSMKDKGGGTWFTIRYTKTQGKPCLILEP